MPDKAELMQNPYKAYQVKEWFLLYDPGSIAYAGHAKFLVCYGANGYDGVEEFDSYEEAVAFMQNG